VNYPPYRIETERLVLRCWNPEDAPLLKATIDRNIEALKPWMPWAHQEPTPVATKSELLRLFRANFDLSKDFVYGVFDKAESKVLGGTGLHRRAGPEALEIGYWIDHAETGKGLAREAARALVAAAFGMDGIDRVEIHHDPANLRSRAIPEALGFTFESLRRRTNTTFPGEFRDSAVWVRYRQWNTKEIPR